MNLDPIHVPDIEPGFAQIVTIDLAAHMGVSVYDDPVQLDIYGLYAPELLHISEGVLVAWSRRRAASHLPDVVRMTIIPSIRPFKWAEPTSLPGQYIGQLWSGHVFWRLEGHNHTAPLGARLT